MAERDDILKAREIRHSEMLKMAAKGGAVVCVRANVPGPEKTTKVAHYVVGRYAARLSTYATESRFLEGADGPAWLARVVRIGPESLKSIAVQQEEASPLGRLADIDVCDSDGVTLTRERLRRCYLCGEPAAVCGREGRHPVPDLLKAMETIAREDAILFATGLVDGAIRAELELEPKFGLVTKTSRGSHFDMDYALMKQAMTAIVPHLARMFALALEDDAPAAIFAQARREGLAAEQAMFAVTGGINAYKGLIFSLGLAAAAAGKAVFGGHAFESVFEFVSRMAEPLVGELDRREIGTFGRKAWSEERIGGARLEAARGMPSVRAAIDRVGEAGREELHRTLCGLIGVVEDTTLFKRVGSKERYEQVRREFAAVTDFSLENMRRLTERCVAGKLTFGGSADLLAVAVFLKRLATAFRFQN